MFYVMNAAIVKLFYRYHVKHRIKIKLLYFEINPTLIILIIMVPPLKGLIGMKITLDLEYDLI